MTSTLVKKYGHMWARNLANIARLKKQTGDGVYVLYDGSLPVYVGMGNISSRIKKARNSKRRGQMWDHFSWFVPSNPQLTRDIEALLLRMLPLPLRLLNRQRGKLRGSVKVEQVKTHNSPEFITRKMPPNRKTSRKG
jgi:hypothetical protein